MPVVGKADVKFDANSEDYIRLSKCRRLFNGIVLEKIFIRKSPKGFPRCNDEEVTIWGVLFYTIVIMGLIFSAILLSSELYNIVQLVVPGVTIILGIIFWRLHNIAVIRNKFSDAYLEYLRGYESVFKDLHTANWKSSIPIVDVSSDKTAEARNLGAYHAMKFFAPGRPKDIVKILANANYSNISEYNKFIRKYTKITRPLIKQWREFDEKYNFELQLIEYYNLVYPFGYYSSNPIEQQFYDKRRAKELEQKGFRGLEVGNDRFEDYRFLANTFDLRNPDAKLNASEIYTDIKEYVDPVDGEIYRYRTEKELEDIKNRRKTK